MLSTFFTRKRKASTNHRRTQFDYESLEEKNLLASITPNAATGVITIQGSNGIDNLLITDVNSYADIRIDFEADGEQFDPNVHTYPRSIYTEVLVYAHAQNDVLDNQSFLNGRLYGGSGDDTISGGWISDWLYGQDGNDTLNARNGNDFLWGGNGNDSLTGSVGTDHINGQNGDDNFYFSSAEPGGETDYVYEAANQGNDRLNFQYLAASTPVTVDISSNGVVASHTNRIVSSQNAANFEYIFGGEGNDSLKGNSAGNQINGRGGNDVIWGLNGNDVIWGGSGNDNLNGGNGNDNINGGTGDDGYHFGTATTPENDYLYESTGTDHLVFASLGASDGVNVDMSGSGFFKVAEHTNRNVYVPSGPATLFENASGGAGDDTLLGNSANNYLAGNAGSDYLDGNLASDHLVGGIGNDVYAFGDVLGPLSDNDLVIEHAGEGIDSLDFRNFTDGTNDTVSVDFNSNTNVVATHVFRTVRVQSAGYGVHLENAFGSDDNSESDIWSFDGTGQTVAIIDSGIDYNHNDLGGGLGNRVLDGEDFGSGDMDPMDDEASEDGHGTHVAGIVGNTNAVHAGLATGVDFVALKIFGTGGSATPVADSLQWIIDHEQEHSITTVNMSFRMSGNNNFTGDVTDSFGVHSRLIQLNDAGLFLAAAAGNEFGTGVGEFDTPGLQYPAANPNVVAVSAHDGTNVANFSQIRHDVLVAPGVNITSTEPGNTSGVKSGTSMASPYVAGASILLREAYESIGMPDVDQDTLYAVFVDSADDLFHPATSATYHQLNLERALAWVTVDRYVPVVGSSTQGPPPPMSGGGGPGGLSVDQPVEENVLVVEQNSFVTPTSSTGLEWNQQTQPIQTDLTLADSIDTNSVEFDRQDYDQSLDTTTDSYFEDFDATLPSELLELGI